MVKYFFNPKNGDLILFDDKESELFVIECIKNVRVFVEKDVQMGDYKENREKLKGNGFKQGHKEVSDHEAGLGEDNYPVKKRNKITPEILEQMKKMRQEGISDAKIAKQFGVSYFTVHRYLKD